MAMVAFRCPQCGKRLRAPEGQKARCPLCGAAVRVPKDHSDSEAEPVIELLTLAIIVMVGILGLGVFVGWVYRHEALKTEHRLTGALTPAEKQELEGKAARLQQQIADRKQDIEAIRGRILAVESEAQQSFGALDTLQRRKRELEKARRAFLELLSKVELQPADLGIEDP